MVIHRLKILPEYFEAQKNRVKTFEIRKNDRNFKVGDKLMLYEINSKTKQKTGRVLEVQVTYITDYAQKEDYVVMATRLKSFKDSVHMAIYE